MTCCGQRRSAGLPLPNRAQAQAAPSVTIHSLHGTALTVLGPVTGRRYVFAPKGAQAVDRRDAARLVGSRVFRQG